MIVPLVRREEKARFLSPVTGRPVAVTIERRRDPLTGRWSIHSEALKDKAGILFGATDQAWLNQAAEKTQPTCIFCPERVRSITPRYPEEWIKNGYAQKGECFLFPNLFPLAAVHAVAVMGHAHVRRLDEFDPPLLTDAIETCVRFIQSVHRAEPQLRFFTINANYLFPAGASLIHPHLQVLGGNEPVTTVDEFIKACRRFRSEHGVPYHEQLIIEEKQRQKRFAGTTGPVDWISAFAPTGINEFLGVAPVPHLGKTDQGVIAGMAEGLSRVLAYYHELGFSTFNFTIYSAAMDTDETAFPVVARVICRQNVYPFYRTDDYFVQKLLGEELVVRTPEELASGLRSFAP